MAWCEKHHQALFVITHDRELRVATNILYQAFPYEQVEKIARFRTMADFYAAINFYSHGDVVKAFCKLQGHQIYEGCCELDLYFASEAIYGCKHYISRYMLDHQCPRAPLVSWAIPNNYYRVPYSRLSRGPPVLLFG